MKRFISITVILLALFVAAVYLAKYTDINDGRSSHMNEALPDGEWAIGSPQESGPSTSNPATDKEHTDTVSQDILLVNADNPLPENYSPESFVKLYDKKDRHFQLANADIEICKTVFDAMDAMFAAAQKDGVDGFIITSGYRSYEKQAEVFANSTPGIAAEPGKSEHETGLAFDVTAYGDESFELTSQFEWLSEHCAEYGFIIRYPQGKEDITGVPFEPWHYRYVGREHALAIMSEGITLEEYLEQQ